ncbi:sensor histidine kinase [Sinomicrobium soli]|uniref:sensor histidine kinase n=1 Tax=Sinomicrobium sp. N-1-3-6 TaxID=2219864 RepID=UPI001374AD42|nr:sensor histidine kinase [Sinomicrobium sp. N-1-3-6]
MFRNLLYKISPASFALWLFLGLALGAALPVKAHIVEDSLRLELARRNLSEPERIMTMARLAEVVYYRREHKDGFEMIQRALRLADHLEDKHYKAFLFAVLARYYAGDDQMLQAGESMDSAVYYVKNTSHKAVLGYVQYTRGRLMVRENKLREAIIDLFRALEDLEGTEKYEWRSEVYADISDIYGQWSDTQNQRKYAALCMEDARKSGDPDAMTTAIQLKAHSFFDRFTKDMSREHLRDSALYYYKHSVNVLERHRDRVIHLSRLPVAAYHIAEIYSGYLPVSYRDSVFNYLDMAVEEARRIGEHSVLARSYIMLADYAISEEDYTRAEFLVGNAAISVHEDPVANQRIVPKVSQYFSMIREKQGKPAEALQYYKQYVREYTDKFDMEKMALAQKLEAQYEASRKERELAVLQEKLVYGKKLNQLYIGLTIIGFIAVIFLFYANQQRTRAMKQQKQLHLMEMGEIEQKNHIALLSAMLEGQEQERSRLARDLHDGLGGLLSGIKIEMSAVRNILTEAKGQGLMDKTMEHLDDAVNELRRIAHSMMPEILIRYGLGEAIKEYCERFRNSRIRMDCSVFNYTNDMDHSRQMVVYRIMQELVNNAIKHARASLIYVQLQQVEDKIFLTVEDDGVGFDMEAISGKRSAGWTNIRARVEFLGGDMDILSEKGKGTTITIECLMNVNSGSAVS